MVFASLLFWLIVALGASHVSAILLAGASLSPLLFLSASKVPSCSSDPAAWSRALKPRCGTLGATLSSREKERQKKKQEKAAEQRRRLDDERRAVHMKRVREARREQLQRKKETARSKLLPSGPLTRDEKLALQERRRLVQFFNRKKRIELERLKVLEKEKQKQARLAATESRLAEDRAFMESEKKRLQALRSLGRARSRAGKEEKLRELVYLLETSSFLLQIRTKTRGEGLSEFGKGIVSKELAMTAEQHQRLFEAFVNAGIHPYVQLKRAKNSLMRIAAQRAATFTSNRSHEEEAEFERRFWLRYEDSDLTDEEMLAILGVDFQKALLERDQKLEDEAAKRRQVEVASASASHKKKNFSKKAKAKVEAGNIDKGKKSGKSSADQGVPTYDFANGPPLPEPPEYRSAIANAERISREVEKLGEVPGAYRSVAKNAVRLTSFLESDNLYLFVKASPAGEFVIPMALRLLLRHLAEIQEENASRASEAARKQRRRRGDDYDSHLSEDCPFKSFEEMEKAFSFPSKGDFVRQERKLLQQVSLAEAARNAEWLLDSEWFPATSSRPFCPLLGVALTPDGILPSQVLQALSNLPSRKSLMQRLVTFLRRPAREVATSLKAAPSRPGLILQRAVQNLGWTLSVAQNSGWKKLAKENGGACSAKTQEENT